MKYNEKMEVTTLKIYSRPIIPRNVYGIICNVCKPRTYIHYGILRLEGSSL